MAKKLRSRFIKMHNNLHHAIMHNLTHGIQIEPNEGWFQDSWLLTKWIEPMSSPVLQADLVNISKRDGPDLVRRMDSINIVLFK